MSVPVHVLRPLGLRGRVRASPGHVRTGAVSRIRGCVPHVRGFVRSRGCAAVDSGDQGTGDVSGEGGTDGSFVVVWFAVHTPVLLGILIKNINKNIKLFWEVIMMFFFSFFAFPLLSFPFLSFTLSLVSRGVRYKFRWPRTVTTVPVVCDPS